MPYDAIIIGAGHNGLTTAALLARSGRRVVVLERGEAVGGLAAGDEFHPGFTSAGMLHDTCGVRPAALDSLQLGLATDDEPPPCLVPQEREIGPGLLLHREPSQAAAELEAHSPRDATRYAAYREFIDRIRPFVAGLLDTAPPVLDESTASLWSLLGRGLALRRLGRGDMMELLRITPMCLADWLNEWFETELLSAALAAPALAGTRTGPWSPGTTANLLRLETLAGRSVRGGPSALVGALKSAADRHGVEIRTGAEVRRIRTSAGAVEGVTLADGEPVDSRVVAASCDPGQVLLEMLGPGVMSTTSTRRVSALRTSGTTARVDLALRGSLRFGCRPDLDVERARIAGPTLDDAERAFDASKYGRCSDTPMLEVVVPSVADPGLAPEGHHVVSITAHFAPYALRRGWSDMTRDQFGQAVIATLDRYTTDLTDRILAHRVLSPVDIENRYGVTGGHIHHVEHALDQMIVRPVPSCARYATPIKGLFLCGSGSHPGGGLTCGPGRLAAEQIAKS